MNLHTRYTHALGMCLDLIAVGLVIWSVVSFFFRIGDGNMAVLGATCFRYFTIDSNILAALGCLCALPFRLRSILSAEERMPAWVFLFKLVGTCAVTVTLLTVFVFLAPTMEGGLPALLAGNNLHLHLIVPLLCLVSSLLLDGGVTVRLPLGLTGAAPTVVYGILYAVMVIGIGLWPDFYGFNIGGMWGVSMAVMFAASAGLSLGLWGLHELSVRAVKRASARAAHREDAA